MKRTAEHYQKQLILANKEILRLRKQVADLIELLEKIKYKFGHCMEDEAFEKVVRPLFFEMEDRLSELTKNKRSGEK